MTGDFLFDADRLERLMYFHGEPDSADPGAPREMVTQDWLAGQSGVSQGTISKLLLKRQKSVTYRTLERLARPLGVHPLSLACQHDCLWRVTRLADQREVVRLFQLVGRARYLISLTRSFFNFLLPRDLHVHVGVSARPLDTLRPEERAIHIERRGKHWEDQQEARQRSNYVLKIIAPRFTLDLARAMEPGWIEQIVRNMRDHWDDTAVGIADEDGWRAIDDVVRDHLAEGQAHFPDWTKINVADSEVACVYFPGWVAHTDHGPTVLALKELIEHKCAAEIRGQFPATEVSRGVMRGTFTRTAKTIMKTWLPERESVLVPQILLSPPAV